MNKQTNKSNKNKNKKNNKIVIKYKNRVTTLLSSTMHRYIITNIIVLQGPSYTQQNLRLSLSDLLYENPMFLQKKQEYQYFKLVRVMLKFTPVIKSGSNPPSGFLVFLGNEDLGTINYTDLPYLSYKRMINPYKVSRFVFTRPGRQPDFNYWYNTTNFNAIDAYFKMRFDEELQLVDGYYKLETGIEIIFDKPIYQSSNKSKEEEKENVIKSEFKPSVDESPNTEITETMY